jgi:hypothetical protein
MDFQVVFQLNPILPAKSGFAKNRGYAVLP